MPLSQRVGFERSVTIALSFSYSKSTLPVQHRKCILVTIFLHVPQLIPPPRASNLANDGRKMNYRLVAKMDSQSRHLRLAVVHPGPEFVFLVIERDESDIIKQVLETGTADTIEQALGKAEEVAKEYLSRDGEQATVPFWVLEDA